MRYLLRLYVTGQTGSSLHALESIHQICREEFGGDYAVEVIDVLEHPQLAEDEKILATPTLVKKLPPPLRKLVGDLGNRERVLLGLDIVAKVRIESLRESSRDGGDSDSKD